MPSCACHVCVLLRGLPFVPFAAPDSAPSPRATTSESKPSSADTLSALDALLGADPSDDSDANDDEDDDEAPIISIPLLWMQMPGQTPAQQRQTGGSSVASALTNDAAPGPGNVYAAITLGLPDRATKSQQERGVKGVELDFCVDTACTTNFILPQVAYGLDMQIVGTAPAEPARRAPSAAARRCSWAPPSSAVRRPRKASPR